MTVRTCIAVLWLAFLFAMSCGGAFAADCTTLQQLASIPLVKDQNSDVMLVPVSINGHDRYLLLDTGGSITQLTQAAAKDLDLPVMNSDIELFDINGNASHVETKVRRFSIGNLNARDITFPLNPSPSFGGEVAGLLSLDLFTAYDMDIDFGTRKLGYFSPDHCPGKVVYWNENALTIVPMTLHERHITVPVTLDGQSMNAIIDTGSNRTIMDFDTARHFFGLSPDSPGLDPSGFLDGNRDRKTYLRVFNQLSFGAVSVKNPHVTLVPNVMGRNADHSFDPNTLNRVSDSIHLPQLVIGMNILKYLHIYFAFKENNLYITPAETDGHEATTGAH